MTKESAVIWLPVLFFCLTFLPAPLSATIGGAGMPHKIGYKLEPESASVGSTVRITGIVTPAFDVESLRVFLGLPTQRGAKVDAPSIREWRGSGKKGKPIRISGDVVFQKPGRYGFYVMYAYPDPHVPRSYIVDGVNVLIRVPGTVERPGEERGKEGEEIAPSGDKLVSARRLYSGAARKTQPGDTIRAEARSKPQITRFEATGDTLTGPRPLGGEPFVIDNVFEGGGFPARLNPCSGDESRVRIYIRKDSILTHDMFHVTVADGDSVWRFERDNLPERANLPSFWSTPDLEIANSGKLKVSFEVRKPKGRIVSQGAISLPLSRDWRWEINIRRDSKNPLMYHSWGPVDWASFPVLDAAYTATDHDSVYVTWSGNCISNPTIY
jgi:hypothetical protein